MSPDWEPDEHLRFGHYRRAFNEVSADDAAALITRVLTDPDTGMATSAVCEHLDRRAAELLTDVRYPPWCSEMTSLVTANDFLARRLWEWTLLRAMMLNEPWDAQALLTASSWLQRHAAEESSDVAALTLLADGGRNRRIRNIAKSRLPRPAEGKMPPSVRHPDREHLNEARHHRSSASRVKPTSLRRDNGQGAQQVGGAGSGGAQFGACPAEHRAVAGWRPV